ncbi:citrate lyase holo-[acyl-carrier protein] synthase [Levilactobacillus suantsaiihabitans]|nr:citrate lyase holo-[acyl-carrier protein] synthase [Levilactobacillus suantsaiihabitans]
MTVDIFKTGTRVDIATVLANKDRRAAFQQQALRVAPDRTLLSIKLNIPGPIKNNEAITFLFEQGIQVLSALLKKENIVVQQLAHWQGVTGNELFLQTPISARTVKRVAASFEDSSPLGRIFDVDVLDGTGHSWSRTELGADVRRCFICNRPAKECARSRRHTVVELQNYISDLYQKTLTTKE